MTSARLDRRPEIELSWFALAPTILIALILATVVLLRSDDHARIQFGKRGPEAPPGTDPIPTIDTALRRVGSSLRTAGFWLRNARKPVRPIDSGDVSARVRRGLKVAGLMVIAALWMTATALSDGGNWWLLVIEIAIVPFAAIGGITSVTHTLVLRMLPYRGPIASIALGTALGIAAAFVLRNTMFPARALILSGMIYGAAIGVIDTSIEEKAVRPITAR
jgi:hypothetical protein